jgi:hypothetical protein
MSNNSPNNSGSAALSWGVFSLALAFVVSLCWYVPIDRAQYEAIMKDFHMELPGITMLVLQIPTIAFWITGGVLSLALIATQLGARSRQTAGLFHMLIVVGCCIAFMAYREAMTQPIVKLIDGISSQTAAPPHPYP